MKAGLVLPDWSCHKCTAGMKRIRGCYEEGRNATILGTEKVTRCPLIFVRDHAPTFNKLTGMWSMMNRGYLPEAGGTEDQQAQIMQALVIFDRAVEEGKIAKRKKSQTATKPD